jgi:uncharacterized protein YdhG (YjbR/CyaY superfamily)
VGSANGGLDTVLRMATSKGDGEAAVREKIGSLRAFRDVAARLHDVITASAPELEPRLWYGMPGYARSKSSPVICFFRVDGDDVVTFGLTEKAHLAVDPSAGHRLMQCAWFLTGIDEPTEERIAEIVRAAAGWSEPPAEAAGSSGTLRP